MQRREDAIKLLQERPLRHNHKVRMKNLILETRDAIYWSEVEGRVRALRKQINDDIGQCKYDARIEYKTKHGSFPTC